LAILYQAHGKSVKSRQRRQQLHPLLHLHLHLRLRLRQRRLYRNEIR
jgi:hypothetical protein